MCAFSNATYMLIRHHDEAYTRRRAQPPLSPIVQIRRGFRRKKGPVLAAANVEGPAKARGRTAGKGEGRRGAAGGASTRRGGGNESVAVCPSYFFLCFLLRRSVCSCICECVKKEERGESRKICPVEEQLRLCEWRARHVG